MERAKERKRKMLPNLEVLLLYAFLIVLSLLFVLPVFYLFMGAFKAQSELFRVPFKWLPDRFTPDNFITMFRSIPFLLYLTNTMIIVACNIAGSLLSCSLAAYGFSRLRWPGRDKVFILVLVTMILPYQVTLVPLFLMFTKMRWIGTFLPLTVTCFFGNPFFIFLLRQFFTGIPQDISEAARIDGAGEFTIFARLVIPVARPALTTVAILKVELQHITLGKVHRFPAIRLGRILPHRFPDIPDFFNLDTPQGGRHVLSV